MIRNNKEEVDSRPCQFLWYGLDSNALQSSDLYHVSVQSSAVLWVSSQEMPMGVSVSTMTSGTCLCHYRVAAIVCLFHFTAY
jgi:hypothetical protein